MYVYVYVYVYVYTYAYTYPPPCYLFLLPPRPRDLRAPPARVRPRRRGLQGDEAARPGHVHRHLGGVRLGQDGGLQDHHEVHRRRHQRRRPAGDREVSLPGGLVGWVMGGRG